VAEAPEITVIIPAYNAERTVGAAVDSVLAQTFADFELLVIDDGSQDTTADVVAARNDRRVKCVRTENGGVSVARNRGLELAAGSYVAFLDADDAWQPTKLERQRLAMRERPEFGLCFASAHYVDDDLHPVGWDEAVVRPDYSEALLLEGNVLAGSASSVMVRASVMKQVGGFDPSLSLCADWDLWLRASVITRFVPVHETLVLYRRLPGTMSSDPKVLERDTFALLEKFYADETSASYTGLRRRAYANQWMVCAGSYLHTGHLRDSLRCIAASLRSDPRAVRRLLSLPARWAGRARRRMLGRPRDDQQAISSRA
jgi:glycosyltransferase involved in cell wall biosynthesis